jgi:hypothetical protein
LNAKVTEPFDCLNLIPLPARKHAASAQTS